jgi:hypothetical protein
MVGQQPFDLSSEEEVDPREQDRRHADKRNTARR